MTRFLVRRLIVAGMAIMIAAPSPGVEGLPVSGMAVIGFQLQDGSGNLVTLNHFLGRNVLVAFGFTNCAHICPMTAANMALALRTSDKDAIGIFVSVDTERDTPEITNTYAQAFGDRMLGLSGDYQQVSDAARKFNVTYVVTKSEDNYSVQHTSSITLIGPDGSLIDVFAINAASDLIAGAMR